MLSEWFNGFALTDPLFSFDPFIVRILTNDGRTCNAYIIFTIYLNGCFKSTLVVLFP